MRGIASLFSGFDIPLFLGALGLSLCGLATMYSFVGSESLFSKQAIWILVSTFALIVAVMPDYRFLRTGNAVIILYLAILAILALILVIGEVTLGALLWPGWMGKLDIERPVCQHRTAFLIFNVSKIG